MREYRKIIFAVFLLGIVGSLFVFGVGKNTQAPESTITPGAQRNIELYYYNPSKDKDEQGNIMCSAVGLEVVNKQIPETATPVEDTIRFLLENKLTSEEKARGLTSEFPLPGVELVSASPKDGGVELRFSDPQHKTSGGSCRSAILWAQIETTALQFPGVNTVWFEPEDLFQP